MENDKLEVISEDLIKSLHVTTHASLKALRDLRASEREVDKAEQNEKNIRQAINQKYSLSNKDLYNEVTGEIIRG